MQEILAFDIYLSPPHLSGDERAFIDEALSSNWVAPTGPQQAAFEREFADVIGVRHALAVTSGTAAIHLALATLGIGPGDEVLVPTHTHCASVNPILYQRGRPTFVDSERTSWNMDPELVEDLLIRRSRLGKRPAAIVVVHLYGQTADLNAFVFLSERFGVPLIEDAAESLGASCNNMPSGSFGKAAAFSFNGNKIITTSGGGMLVSNDDAYIARARKLATQAKEDVPYFQHEEVGYNYRMSNVLAALGRAQLRYLPERVQARRAIFARYMEQLDHLPGLRFMPEASWGIHSRWLTCLLVNPDQFGADAEAIRLGLVTEGIEARPMWKPMHLQPAYDGYEVIGGRVSEELFHTGLCLPSGSALQESQLDNITAVIEKTHRATLCAKPT